MSSSSHSNPAIDQLSHQPSSSSLSQLVHQSSLISHISPSSLSQISPNQIWPQAVEDEDEDDDDQLWGIDNGRQAVGDDEQNSLPSSIPSINLFNTQNNLKLSNSASSSSNLNHPPALTPGIIHPPLPSSHPINPTEEWRSKILDGVRRGEEIVAQRRKQSIASLTGSAISQQSPLSTGSSSTKPSLQPVQDHPNDHLPALASHLPSSSSSSNHPPSSDSSLLKGKRPATQPDHHQTRRHLPPSSSSSVSTDADSLTCASSTGTPSTVLPPTPKNIALRSSSSSSNNNPHLTQVNLTAAELNSHIPFQPSTADPYSSIPQSINSPTPSDHLNRPMTTPFTSRDPDHLNRPMTTNSTPRDRPPSSDPPSRRPTSFQHTRSNSNSQAEAGSRSGSNSHLNPHLSRSSSAVSRAVPSHRPNHRTSLASQASPSAVRLSSDEPPPPADGTFLSIVEPNISSRWAPTPPSSHSTQSHSLPASLSASPNQPSELANGPQHRRPQNSSRSKSGKRNFFSTLLHRASGVASLSNPPSPGHSLAPSGSRNPFDSTFGWPSAATVPEIPRHLVGGVGSEYDCGMSRGPSENSSANPGGSSPAPGTNFATASTLSSMGLKLTPLTPLLQISRNSQPLCGAILDNKYLLIGTNNGLDFVPLAQLIRPNRSGDGRSSHSVGTVRPMSLIKKTRFKSLKVLEVRSNILLAIAGRNDHLRVYALDGIRAIVAKKIQDLAEKEDVVWLPKPASHTTPVNPSKGKGRVPSIHTNAPPTASPLYSPPPPYGGSLAMAKSNSFQPTSTSTTTLDPQPHTASTLRRSSTVGSGAKHSSSAPPVSDARRSSFHSSSDGPSFISPLGLLSPARPPGSVPSTSHGPVRKTLSSEDAVRAVAKPVELGLEREVEEEDDLLELAAPVLAHQFLTAESALSNGLDGDYSTSSHSTDADRAEHPLGPDNSAGQATAPPGKNSLKTQLSGQIGSDESDRLQGTGDGSRSALVEVIKTRSEHLEKANKKRDGELVQDIRARAHSRARLVPRSALATDTDEDSVDGSSGRVHLVDVLSQNVPGTLSNTPLGISVSAPGRESRAPAADNENSHPSDVVRPPSVPIRTTMTSVGSDGSHEMASTNSHVSSSGATLSQTQLQSRRARPGMPSNTSSSAALHRSQPTRTSSAHQSDQEASSTSLSVPKSRKRWSVMDSVFRSHSSSGHPGMGSSGGSPLPMGHLMARSSTDGAADLSSAMPQDGLAGADVGTQSADPSPSLNPRASIQKLRTASPLHSNPLGTADTGPLGGANSWAGTGVAGASSGSGGRVDQPRERLATHFHGQGTGESAKGPPHPATLGAPLEYVKLARTKGAKLLRAVETKRRTYLAVLCGESSERIELFTGSKNISLSLNRTFVLPETPRTIEFQMQGDDLVDIYLVYDESVFALEPATVRVREVGIGRNERRAARRDRDRAARDMASINMRPAVTTNGAAAATIHDVGAFLADGPGLNRSLAETVGLAQRVTAPLAPPVADEGLTLAVPVATAVASGSRHASGAHSATVAAGLVAGAQGGSNASTWGTHEAHSINTTVVPKAPNLWPYTTFQQLQFIPPLPPSVLASAFVIPPTYETVVLAGGGPKTSAGQTPEIGISESVSQDLEPQSSIRADPSAGQTGSQSSSLRAAVGGGEAEFEVGSTPPLSSEGAGASGSAAGAGSAGLGTATAACDAESVPVSALGQETAPYAILADGPLLSPISLLANSANRQTGPPGLFLVTRGKKVTSIVDCDGRSVMKKPFVWANNRHARPSSPQAGAGGFRVELVVVDERRTVLVGIDSAEVKVCEVGGTKPAKGLEEYSNSAAVEVVGQAVVNNSHGPPSAIVGGGHGVGVVGADRLGGHSGMASSTLMGGSGAGGVGGEREVVFLGASTSRNEVVWAERMGNSFGIYSLAGR